MESKAKYKVSLYASRGGFPFWFAVHVWLVVENSGTVSRWEVIHYNINSKNNWGHIFLNFFPPTQGLGILFWNIKPAWPGRTLGSIEGGEGSEAERLAKFVGNSYQTYPYHDKYSFTGANSNTYAQWILNNFPEFKVKLPWNAFGKNFK